MTYLTPNRSIIAAVPQKQLPDYDPEASNELTLYNNEIRADEKGMKLDFTSQPLVMDESDVVLQHENRLKIEVERHIKPADSILSNTEQPKRTVIDAPQSSAVPPPTAIKAPKRPSVSYYWHIEEISSNAGS